MQAEQKNNDKGKIMATSPSEKMETRFSQNKYKAFISYSHTRDKSLAPRIQNALRSLAKPWYKLEALTIFIDQTNLSAAPELWPRIQQALQQSEYFILLASPEAANSEWVKKEIDYWLAHKSKDTLLIALTSGIIRWDQEAIDWKTTNALPSAVDNVFIHEPNYADFTLFKNDECTLENRAFCEQIAKLAAPLHGLSVGELIGDQERQFRNTLRIRNGVIIVLTLLAATIFYFYNQVRAESQANALALEAITYEEIDPTLAHRKVLSAYKMSGDVSLLGIATNIYGRYNTYRQRYAFKDILACDYDGRNFLALTDSSTVIFGSSGDTTIISLSQSVKEPRSIQINPQQSHFIICAEGRIYLFAIEGHLNKSFNAIHGQFQFPTGNLHIFHSPLRASIFSKELNYDSVIRHSHYKQNAIGLDTNANLAIEMSADGKVVAWKDNYKCLVLDNRTLKPRLREIPVSSNSIVAVSGSGKYVAISNGFAIHIIDKSGRVDTLKAHSNYPTAMKFTPNEDALISTGEDYRGYFHLIANNSSKPLLAHMTTPYVTVASTGAGFVTYDKRHAYRWDFTDIPAITLLKQENLNANAVLFSPNGNYIAGGNMEGKWWVWKRSGELVMHGVDMSPSATKQKTFTFSKDNSKFYFLDSSRLSVNVFDIYKKRMLHNFKETNEPVTCIAIFDNQITGFTESGKFVKWTPDGKEVVEKPVHPKLKNITSFVVRRNYLITTDDDGDATIYDENGKILRQYRYDAEGTIVQSADLSSNDKYLMIGPNGGTAKLVENPLSSEGVIPFIPTRVSYVIGVRFLNKKPGVVTCGDDQHFRLWDNDFRPISAVNTGAASIVWDIDISNNDDEIVTGDDTSIKIWRLRSYFAN